MTTTQNKVQLTFSEDELKIARAAFGEYTFSGGAETSFNKYLKSLIMQEVKKK